MNIYNKELSNNEIIKWVKKYYKDISTKKSSRFNAILSMFEKSNKLEVLDYGCGWGCISFALSSMGHKVKGIDLDSNEIKISKLVWGENDNLSFKNHGIGKFKDSSFDRIISSQVIEHVHNVGNYLSEINRILKDSGELIITLPNIMTPRFIILNFRNSLFKKLNLLNKNIIQGFDKRDLHINSWDPLHFTHLISTLGFEILEIKMSEGLPIPFLGYLNLPFLKNFRYTMCFKLKKVKNIRIKSDD